MICVGVGLFIFAFGMICGAAQMENGDSMNDILVNVLVSVITAAITAAASYFLLLKRMPDNVADKVGKALDKKMDPSNKALQDEQLKVIDFLNPSNSILHDDHEELRSYLEADARRNAVADARYNNLDTSQTAMVDAIHHLDGMGKMMEALVSENQRLQGEVQQLRRELEVHREHQHNHSCEWER